MSFVKGLPKWDAVGVEPPSEKTTGGWVAGDKPPAEYLNWSQNLTYEALKELQEKAKENGNADVRVATTNNITLSGAQTIDGVAVVAGDRVLVKGQSTGSQNGIYVVAAGAWSRAKDADSSAKIDAGISAFVREGTLGAKTHWRMGNTGTITLGTTALVFVSATVSPAFSGTPTVPTASADQNDAQIVNTNWYHNQKATTTPVMNGAGAVGTSLKWARADHEHPTDSTRAPLNSPALTGSPTAPTVSAGDSSTKIATTAHVRSEVGDRTSLLTTAKNTIVAAMNELFTFVSNGKTAIAAAITGKGVSASGSDSFSTLSSKIDSIPLASGNAAVGDVLATKTFSNGTSNGLTGTMPNRGAVTITPSASNQTIAAGYHNGSGSVPAVSVPAANVKTGTAIAGTAGTMPDNGTLNYTPSASSQTIPAGYTSGGTIAAVSSGTYKMFATGVTASNATADLIVTGLPFTPTMVIVYLTTPNTTVRGLFQLAVFPTSLPLFSGGPISQYIGYLSSSGQYFPTHYAATNGAGSFDLDTVVADANYTWYAFA